MNHPVHVCSRTQTYVYYLRNVQYTYGSKAVLESLCWVSGVVKNLYISLIILFPRLFEQIQLVRALERIISSVETMLHGNDIDVN